MLSDPPLLPRSVSPTAADRLIRNQKQVAHVKQLWIFLGSILVFFTLVNIIRRLWARLAPLHKESGLPNEKFDEEKSKHPHQENHLPSRLYRSLSAITTAFRIVFFRLRVPVGSGSISELVFILGYVAAMFIWLFVDTRDLLPMMYQDRAALIASSQIPLVVALAGKNNIISLLTGVGHEKLNVLHRASARTIFIFFWIHASRRIASGLPQAFDFTHVWMRSGALSLTALTLATILSIRPIRHAAFELFLVAHILLILIFIVAGYYHAKELQYASFPDPFQNYIWPGLLIWGIDRFIRLGRLFWNSRAWNRGACNPQPVDALVELVTEDTIRLTMRRYTSWTPGQHAYIILPSVSTMLFEAHPFTIASIPQDSGEVSDLIFLVRGRGGFTQRLRDFAEKEHGSRIPALIDGPYGCPPDLKRFSTCVLIAGGSGISYTLPLLLSLIKANTCGNKSAVQKVVFVWVIRDAAHVKWISEILMKALNCTTPSLAIDPKIYITGDLRTHVIPEDSASVTTSSRSSVNQDAISLPEYQPYSCLSAVHGRPNLELLLNNEIELSRGPLSVDVAGPSSLANCVRRALSGNLSGPKAALKGHNSVTLHVETFGM